jgi:hypothetical protein
MFSNFLQRAMGQIKVSFFITLCLVWGIIMMRHRRASVNGVDTTYQLQTASIKYRPKNFPLNNSTELINSSIIIHNIVGNQANNQFKYQQHQIRKLLISNKKLSDGNTL